MPWAVLPRGFRTGANANKGFGTPATPECPDTKKVELPGIPACNCVENLIKRLAVEKDAQGRARADYRPLFRVRGRGDAAGNRSRLSRVLASMLAEDLWLHDELVEAGQGGSRILGIGDHRGLHTQRARQVLGVDSGNEGKERGIGRFAA